VADAPAAVFTWVLAGYGAKYMKIIAQFLAAELTTVALVSRYSHGSRS